METKIATIVREEADTKLVFQLQTTQHSIVITEDNPNAIKSVFNEILKELKNGLFAFDLQDAGDDLTHHICKEYITQLNAEIVAIYNELVAYGLTETSTNHASQQFAEASSSDAADPVLETALPERSADGVADAETIGISSLHIEVR